MLTMMKQDIHIDDAQKLREVLQVLDLDQLLAIARKLRDLYEKRHGEVILTVKNGELAYIDKRESEDVRRRRTQEN